MLLESGTGFYWPAFRHIVILFLCIILQKIWLFKKTHIVLQQKLAEITLPICLKFTRIETMLVKHLL